MNAYYVLSILAGRLFQVLTVVALSYLLSAPDFGIFVIILTNSLLIHILFSSWISSSSSRDIPSLQGQDQDVRISNALGLAAALSILPLSLAAALVVIDADKFQYFSVTLIAAVATLFYELVLVVNNARKQSRSYSLISLLRASLTFGLSLALVFAGFGLWGAVAGQIAGTALAVASLPSFWTMWRNMEPRRISRGAIGGQFKFGLVSAFAMNSYLIASAMCRNFVLIRLGEAEAGYFSLSADIFYAPVALFSTALSLSNVPDLYRKAVDGTGGPQSSDFLTAVLAICIPYALAGLFVGPSIAALFLGPDVSEHIGEIAAHSIVHSACFCILSTQTTIALTQGRLKLAVGLPVATIILLAGLLLGTSFVLGPDGISLLRYAQAVTIGLLLVTIAILFVSRPLLHVSIPWRESLRILGACAAMCLVLALLAGSPLPFAPFPSILLGGATFVGTAWLLGSRAVRNLARLSSG